jgi:hypothetical protein
MNMRQNEEHRPWGNAEVDRGGLERRASVTNVDEDRGAVLLKLEAGGILLLILEASDWEAKGVCISERRTCAHLRVLCMNWQGSGQYSCFSRRNDRR